MHGGIIAELFDELLGLANIVAAQPGMTGTLKIRYHRPTPLLAPLDLVARVTGREGRKIYTWGGIYHEGELTAEADGIFIEVIPGQMLDIVAGNAGGGAEAPLVDRAWRRMMAEGVESISPRVRPERPCSNGPVFYVLIFSLARRRPDRRVRLNGDEAPEDDGVRGGAGAPRRLGQPLGASLADEQLGAPQPQGAAGAVTARQAQASLSRSDHRRTEALERLDGMIE